MPLILKKVKKSRANPLKSDPSQTGMLRRLFSQGMARKMDELRQRITDLVVTQDVFGLSSPVNPLMNTRWQFSTTSQQVGQFLTWLQDQMREMFYQQAEDSWWNEYIRRGWQQGANRAWNAWKTTPKTDLLNAFNQPVSLEKVKLLAGRVYTELKGVTQAMATAMSRALVDGLTRGDSPRDVGKALNLNVDKIGRVRANAIAQTETVRAHAEGQLDMLESVGMQNVGVSVEWSTSHLGVTRITGSKKKGTQKGGNPSPCAVCKPMEGVVFTIQEARGMIPRHPNCHCSFLPANVGEDGRGQIRGKKKISAALDASIRAEIPPTSKRTLAEQRSRTSWAGADAEISKERPESVLNFDPSQKRDDHGRWLGSDSTGLGFAKVPGDVLHRLHSGDSPEPEPVLKRVSIAKLFSLPEQPDLNPEVVRDYMAEKHSEPIGVTEYEGHFIVDDGNHRAWAARLRGDKTIEAFVSVINTFCPTGLGGGVNPTCGNPETYDQMYSRAIKLGIQLGEEQRKISATLPPNKWDEASVDLLNRALALSETYKKILAERKFLLEQIKHHPEEIDKKQHPERERERAAQADLDKHLKSLIKPTSSVKGTLWTVADLNAASFSAGKKLYGEDLLHAGITKIAYRKLTTRSSPGNIDYVFFPSKPGRGLDIHGSSKLTKEMADQDGNIYIYSATDSSGGVPHVKIYKVGK